MPASRLENHFERTQHFSCTYAPHKVTEYISKRTGIRVVVVDQPGPKIQGFFAAATEIFDDSGSPHTLEHLIFMGSRQYPFKGLLDKLATRAYSTTNAWTATDHTAYTLDTGGYEAFAQILPVYLEHVVLPTLTDSACLTEVHHIDGKGHDAGVVYSEMQGVQNQGPELMELQGKRLMYPEGIGFRYETGGMMEKLRVLTANRIRQFHRDMYQPKNLCVIVIGEVDHDHLIQTMNTFETSIIEHIPSPDAPFKRPWVDSIQPQRPTSSISELVEFPEEDESMGEISIKYLGPHCEDIVKSTALAILLSYLAGSSASILENLLVEKEQLASGVYYSQTPRPSSVTEFALTGVDASRLREVEKRFLDIIHDTVENPFDMDYMKDCISKEKRQQMLYAEQSESFFTSSIITTFLFSKDRNLRYLANLDEFDEISKWEESQWRLFMKTWIVDNPHITVLGHPSAALAEKMREDEEIRVASQIESLGEEGLEQARKNLDAAKAYNDRPIPAELFSRFEVPSPETIHFISTTSARAGTTMNPRDPANEIQQIIDEDSKSSPLFLHFEHIPSNFTSVSILICTSQIPVQLRPLLPVYLENFFNQPIKRGGEQIVFENVVKELQRDMVDYDISSGSEFGNAEMLSVKFRVQTDDYDNAIRWFNDLLWNGVFDPERIESAIAKILADVPEQKRSGSGMVYAISSMTDYAAESIRRAGGTLVKAVYLKKIRRMLQTDPRELIERFEVVRRVLGDVSNFRVLVIGDIKKLNKPVSSWDMMTKDKDLSMPLKPLDSIVDRLSEAGKSCGDRAFVVSIPSTDSSFALSAATAPKDSKDPKNPALMVAIALLDAVEGPLWTEIRGTGLAYGTNFRRRLGRLEFLAYSSPDASKAFAAAKTVIEEFISEKRQIEPLALEGAVSSIVLSIVNEEPTFASAATVKFVMEVVKDLPRDWNDTVLQKVRKVTATEIRAVMKDLLLPLFTPNTSNLFVTIAPVMKTNILKGFEVLGYHPEMRSLSSFEDDYGLEGSVGDDEDSESDDDRSDDDEGTCKPEDA